MKFTEKGVDNFYTKKENSNRNKNVKKLMLEKKKESLKKQKQGSVNYKGNVEKKQDRLQKDFEGNVMKQMKEKEESAKRKLKKNIF